LKKAKKHFKKIRNPPKRSKKQKKFVNSFQEKGKSEKLRISFEKSEKKSPKARKAKSLKLTDNQKKAANNLYADMVGC